MTENNVLKNEAKQLKLEIRDNVIRTDSHATKEIKYFLFGKWTDLVKNCKCAIFDAKGKDAP